MPLLGPHIVTDNMQPCKSTTASTFVPIRSYLVENHYFPSQGQTVDKGLRTIQVIDSFKSSLRRVGAVRELTGGYMWHTRAALVRIEVSATLAAQGQQIFRLDRTSKPLTNRRHVDSPDRFLKTNEKQHTCLEVCTQESIEKKCGTLCGLEGF